MQYSTRKTVVKYLKRVATGEQCQNRIVFKQLMASGGVHFVQIDSCRVAGVNEIVLILLMAKKFNLPVCPHAGGVGTGLSLSLPPKHTSMYL